MAGAGWDAEVMAAATRELKDRWGFGAYLFAGLRRAVAPRSADFHITADDLEFEVRAATVIVANAGQLVYDLLPLELRIGPGVSFTDGLLDVCIFAPRNAPDVARGPLARRQPPLHGRRAADLPAGAAHPHRGRPAHRQPGGRRRLRADAPGGARGGGGGARAAPRVNRRARRRER